VDTTTEIQTFLTIAFLIFIVFAGVILYLLVKLLTNQQFLKRAQAKLQDYATNLEKMVEQRTIEYKEAEEKYKNLFMSSKESIILFKSSTGEVIDVNSEAENLLGWSRDELLEKNFSDFTLADVLSAGKGGWKERLIERKDGSNKVIDCLIGEIDISGERFNQVLCRDITEKRELEAQVIQSQKMASLGQLAAGVAHELNTPLGTMYNSSYFIKGELERESPTVQKHLGIIENQIERCRRIIKDLLTFSKAPSTKLDLKKTEINDLIKNCLALIEKEVKSNGTQVIIDLQDLPPIILDPSRFSNVILNLILNAVQAMPSGGELRVRTWFDKNTTGLLNIEDVTQVIHATFEDTGIGIPDETPPKIFTPFFTTKKATESIGLGLSVCFQIVNIFKGIIKVDSKVNVGTTVTVSLPIQG
jgi:PAS domain S-box-containing protein